MPKISLETRIESAFQLGPQAVGSSEAEAAFLELRDALTHGTLRAAEPDAAQRLGWRVNAWVKRGILLGFRIGHLAESGGDLSFVDKHTYPVQHFSASGK